MPVVLNRNEILRRATRFSADWRDATRERAEAQTFWHEFFRVFGVGDRQHRNFEYEARRHSTGRIGWMDVFAPGDLAVEHKSRGEDLDAALDQLRDYLVGLPETLQPKLALVCDFAQFKGYDLDTGKTFDFTLAELPDRIDMFLFLAGHEFRAGAGSQQEVEVNLQATRLMADLHDHLRISGYTGHPLRMFLVRLLFILFADDTDVWDRGLFQYWLTNKTRLDGSDLGSAMAHLFQVLNTPRDRRPATLDEDLSDFEYINGDLFHESLPIPACDSHMRELVLAACAFNWTRISPAIFGSMFQDVMTNQERRQLGAHYTTEGNILRTIRPLFLDSLEAELAAANSRQALDRFRDRLGELTFFDPACGCGNFLIIAYREVRRLELKCMKRIRDLEIAHSLGSGYRRRTAAQRRAKAAGQLSIDVTMESRVRVSQFYGIEIEEFPARIAETAIYLMDHLANLELSYEFGEYFVRFPITDTATIVIGNALRKDWNTILLADDCDYLFGNPPFSGHYTRTPGQTEDLQLVWGRGYQGYLDYVTGWYVKAIEYVGRRATKVAFVSTNSICMGEAVPHLWKPIFDNGFAIDFAHRTFIWTSEARGAAGVHVVIVGFSQDAGARTRLLFDYPLYGRGEPTLLKVSRINPYLIDGPNVLVRARNAPLSRDIPNVQYGNMPLDNGGLLIEPNEIESVKADPHAAKYIRPFIGANELLYGEERWCLWMVELDPVDRRASPILKERINRVRAWRLSRTRAATVAAAATPHLFGEIRPLGDDRYLAIPRHVGEARQYFTVAYCEPEVITGDHNFVAPDPDGYLFALMSSSMFMAWMRTVAGRVRADPRFSKTLVWHNFPLPDVDAQKRAQVVGAGQAILEARALYPDRSLVDLYDRDAMPARLVRAHRELDSVVNRCFTRSQVRSEADRQRVLFQRYAELQAEEQLVAQPSQLGRHR